MTAAAGTWTATLLGSSVAVSSAHGGAAPVGEEVFRSGPQQVTLLELYTSEGCSSCPPAEAWLGRFRADPKLWREVVPVAFHVNYWDRLGWRDTLATPAFTGRQYAYAERWKAESVYTPCFVRNGTEWKREDHSGWRSSRAAEPGELTLAWASENRRAQVHFAPRPGMKMSRPEVTVALLGNGIAHVIRSGENSGRELRHEFVALAVETQRLRNTAEGWTAEFTLPPSTPAEAATLAIAAWITSERGGVVVQAVGGEAGIK